MKVICIDGDFGYNVDDNGNYLPLGWIPKQGQIYNIINEKKAFGRLFYSLEEAPSDDEWFDASCFRPIDFGDDVCTEFEKEFIEEHEEIFV